MMVRVRVLAVGAVGLVLALTGCSKGFTQEELDAAVAEAVESAVSTVATTAEVPSPVTSILLTTTTEDKTRTFSREGEIRFGIGLLMYGTCPEMVREIQKVARLPFLDTNALITADLIFSDEWPDFEDLNLWVEGYVLPASRIVNLVASNSNLHLPLTQYADELKRELRGLALEAQFAAFSGLNDAAHLLDWFDGLDEFDERVDDIPSCN